jgi:hypothetical protein
VAGDKGQWGFVLQGMRPAVAQAAEWWQGAVLIIEEVSGVMEFRSSDSLPSLPFLVSLRLYSLDFIL